MDLTPLVAKITADASGFQREVAAAQARADKFKSQLDVLGNSSFAKKIKTQMAAANIKEELEKITHASSKAGRALEYMAAKAKAANTGLTGSLRGMAAGVYYNVRNFQMLGRIAVGAFKEMEGAARTQVVAQFFQNVGKDINLYRRETQGLISDAQLMRKANTADSMGLSEKTFLNLAKVAQAASAKTGQGFDHMFESIILGTARSSRLLLDNLGIIVSVDEANKNYIKTHKEVFAAELARGDSIAKITSHLSDEAKKLAFVEEVERKSVGMKEELTKVTENQAATFDKLYAALDNLKTSFFGAPIPATAGVLGYMIDMLETMRDMITLAPSLGAIKDALLYGDTSMLKANEDLVDSFQELQLSLLTVGRRLGAVKNIADVKAMVAADDRTNWTEASTALGLPVSEAQKTFDHMLQNLKEMNTKLKALGSPQALMSPKQQHRGGEGLPGTDTSKGGSTKGPKYKKWAADFRDQAILLHNFGGMGANTSGFGQGPSMGNQGKFSLDWQNAHYVESAQTDAVTEAMDQVIKDHEEALAQWLFYEKATADHRVQLQEDLIQGMATLFPVLGQISQGNIGGALSLAGATAGAALGGPVGAAAGSGIADLFAPFIEKLPGVGRLLGLITSSFENLVYLALDPFQEVFVQYGKMIQKLAPALGVLVGSITTALAPALLASVEAFTFLATAASNVFILFSGVVSWLGAFVGLVGEWMGFFSQGSINFESALDSMTEKAVELANAFTYSARYLMRTVLGMSEQEANKFGQELFYFNGQIFNSKKDELKARIEAEGANTDATIENTKAVNNLAQEIRNMPAGYRANYAMYQSQNDLDVEKKRGEWLRNVGNFRGGGMPSPADMFRGRF